MRHRLLALLLAIVITPVMVHAGTITTFSSRSLFNAAVGATTTETFGPSACFPLTGPLSSSSSYGCLPAGTIQAGATYAAPIVAGNSFNIDAGGGFATPFLDSLLLGRPAGSADLTVTFTNPVAAVGFDSNNLMGTQFSIRFNFFDGSTTLNGSLSSSMSFFGYQSSAANIRSVVIGGDSTSFGFALDDFSFGGNPSRPDCGAGCQPIRGQAVPEPASFLLLGLGLAGGVLFKRKRI